MEIFGSLSSKLQKITRKMGGKARVTEDDIKEMMREIQLALLEADVNFKLVKELVRDISEKAKGSEIHKSLTPGQQIVKIVNESLIEMLGSAEAKLVVNPAGFTVIMLLGLQGSGKTTTAAKLAGLLRKKGKKPFLVSVDVHRPAAAKQLEILAKQLNIPCFTKEEEKNPVLIAEEARQRAQYLLCDTLIVDTAGRMTVDDDLMAELSDLEINIKADDKLLIVDAMIGQEAVEIAKSFQEKIGIDGFIMTKLDGDARGGAALSIHKMTNKPIKFICLGEKLDAIETFHPDRMVSRILGMGDVISLIEKLSQDIDEDSINNTILNMSKNKFTMEDMLSQFEQVKKMGSLKDLVSMIPGIKAEHIDDNKLDDRLIDRNMAIIRSMTLKERKNVNLLDASRRKRIASGSGTSVQEVNRLVKQYEQANTMMKNMGLMGNKFGKGFGKKASMLKNLFTKGGKFPW